MERNLTVIVGGLLLGSLFLALALSTLFFNHACGTGKPDKSGPYVRGVYAVVRRASCFWVGVENTVTLTVSSGTKRTRAPVRPLKSFMIRSK